MLQVTDQAASVFQQILQHPEVDGSAIRIETIEAPGGETGITFQPVGGPTEGDVEGAAAGVDVYVSEELVEPLGTVILDARTTDEGVELFLRPQDAEADGN